MEDIIRLEKSIGDLRLDDCPFCGSYDVVYAEYQHKAGKRWRVVCMCCLATIDPGHAQDRSTVQKMWNRRAEESKVEKHGKWECGGDEIVSCSVCEMDYSLYRKILYPRNYCPNCGAKMDL